jgi:hypothetical protein
MLRCNAMPYDPKEKPMLTIGDHFPAFDLAAVKGGPEGLNLKDAFTRITQASWRPTSPTAIA